MNSLTYTVLGVIAQSSIQPCNEQGNRATLSAIWYLADMESDLVPFDQIRAALTELQEAGLIEHVEDNPHFYRLAPVPAAVVA